MNYQDRIKELINSLKTICNEEESKDLSKILGKILSILYGKENINILNEEDIKYLNDKNFFDDLDTEYFINYLNYAKQGYYLSDSTLDNMLKILKTNAKRYNKINEKWKNNNTILNFIQVPGYLDTLDKNEIIKIVNIINNTDFDDNEKEDLLISLSINLNNKK